MIVFNLQVSRVGMGAESQRRLGVSANVTRKNATEIAPKLIFGTVQRNTGTFIVL